MFTLLARSVAGIRLALPSRQTLFGSRLSRIDKTSPGRVDLVGAGPGDPELITRKGWRLIEQCEVLLYDALVSPELMAQIPLHVQRIYVGKLKGQHSHSQREICELLVKLARQGHRVVRLKGGDPLIFGRLGEELNTLKSADIPFSIVPGISAAAGCAASCGFPLTERGQSARLRLITAHACDDREINWQDLARADETLVFYMGLSMASAISHGLQAAGLPPDWPALLVEKGTREGQRTLACTLAELPQMVQQHQLRSPTLIYVGSVVTQHHSAPTGVSTENRSAT